MGVLDLRGTHGSGKSWVMHRLIARYGYEPILEDGAVLGGHLKAVDAAVLGRYERVCGGCDGIATADEVVRRVRLFAGQYRHVLLEGILVAHTFKRYSALATELKDYGYTFAFLNTPLEECIRRVKARREAAGNAKPFNPRNVEKDWHNINGRVKVSCYRAGHRILVLDYRDPLPPLFKVLT